MLASPSIKRTKSSSWDNQLEFYTQNSSCTQIVNYGVLSD